MYLMFVKLNFLRLIIHKEKKNCLPIEPLTTNHRYVYFFFWHCMYLIGFCGCFRSEGWHHDTFTRKRQEKVLNSALSKQFPINPWFIELEKVSLNLFLYVGARASLSSWSTVQPTQIFFIYNATVFTDFFYVYRSKLISKAARWLDPQLIWEVSVLQQMHHIIRWSLLGAKSYWGSGRRLCIKYLIHWSILEAETFDAAHYWSLPAWLLIMLFYAFESHLYFKRTIIAADWSNSVFMLAYLQ